MNNRGVLGGFRWLKCTFKSSSPSSKRTFTSSPSHRRHGAVPTFTPTSSLELDELFSSIRNKVFLPSHLSSSHRDLMFKTKLQRSLDAEPVFATIAGERFQLTHIDATKEVPGRASFIHAIRLMKEPRDWDNLPFLLLGLKDAKISLKLHKMIARRAGRAGRIDTLLESARRVADTDFSLGRPGLLAELMQNLQSKAVKSDWAAKDVKQAYSWAQMFFDLLENPRHYTRTGSDAVDDLKVQPQVIGILLQLSAARAIVLQNGKDIDGKVAEYAARLHSAPAAPLTPEYWRENAHQLLDRKKPISQPQYAEAIADNHYLASMVPVLHGAKLATQVLGQAEGLATLISGLEQSIMRQREILLASGSKNKQGTQLRGLSSYDELLGPNAKPVLKAKALKP